MSNGTVRGLNQYGSHGKKNNEFNNDKSVKDIKLENKVSTSRQKDAFYDPESIKVETSGFAILKTYTNTAHNSMRKLFTSSSNKERLDKIDRQEAFNLETREKLKDSYTSANLKSDAIDVAGYALTGIAITTGVGVGAALIGGAVRVVATSAARQAVATGAKNMLTKGGREAIATSLKRSADKLPNEAVGKAVKDSLNANPSVGNIIRQGGRVVIRNKRATITKKAGFATAVGVLGTRGSLVAKEEIKDAQDALMTIKQMDHLKESNKDVTLFDAVNIINSDKVGNKTEITDFNEQLNTLKR